MAEILELTISGESSVSLPQITKQGISLFTACLFIVGEIAGAGVLAMPAALKSTGWILGTTLLLVTCAGSGFCGVLLGECWVLVEQKDESLKTIKTRNPYSVIGEKSFGRWGSIVTIVSLIITMFGGSIVLLLLSAEMIHSILQPLMSFEISFGEWIIITGLVLLPFSFLGSPVDFSPVALFAMGSTSVAAVLIVISCVTTEAVSFHSMPEYHISFMGILVGTGSMCFAFCGASGMPTIQNDMRDKSSFAKSVIIAFVILLMIYMPVAVISYDRFGNSVKANIIRNLTPSALTTTIQLLMTGHVLCAYLIVVNPVNLNIENYFEFDHSFNFIRCISRSLVTLSAIFIGLSVPKFGKLLSLVGASAVVVQTYILPAIFYYKLKNSEDAPVGIKMKILIFGIIAAAVLTAVGASASATFDLFDPQAFTYPCYIVNCNLD